jgi:hypothetical protein
MNGAYHPAYDRYSILRIIISKKINPWEYCVLRHYLKMSASDWWFRVFLLNILYSFSSVVHVWVPGTKTTGPIAKKFVFPKFFRQWEISSFNTIHTCFFQGVNSHRFSCPFMSMQVTSLAINKARWRKDSELRKIIVLKGDLSLARLPHCHRSWRLLHNIGSPKTPFNGSSIWVKQVWTLYMHSK